MNTISPVQHDNTAATSIDLMPYINALIAARWWVLVAALASGIVTAAWAYSKPYMDQSGVKVSVVDISDPGGVSPDDRRASELLTLVQHGFVLGTNRHSHARQCAKGIGA
jgi:hypothetical protein